MGKAYTQKNTHLQTAPSQPANQSLQESIFYPNPRQIKNKKSSPSQKNKTYSADKQRHTDNEKEALGGNSVYVAIAGSVVNRRSVLLGNLVLNGQLSASNPLLHIHANRCT